MHLNQSIDERSHLQLKLSNMMIERDGFRSDAKDLLEERELLAKRNKLIINSLKDRCAQQELRIRDLEEQGQVMITRNIDLERSNKFLTLEQEKLKARIQKLINRKGKVDEGLKQCKLCTRQYIEKENFNWSCRTHPSDWGGEMWWCCGKRSKDQPGCKFAKHRSGDDNDIDEEKSKELPRNTKYVRCLCCRETGHATDQCFRDPNLKTGEQDVELDFERIKKIQDFRKLHANTLVNTTHMIKKAVMVPMGTDEEGLPLLTDNLNSPFQRGIMNFDDYNYKNVNPYILVTKQGLQKLEKDRDKKVQDKTNLQAISEDQMRAYSQEDTYEHGAITVQPSDFDASQQFQSPTKIQELKCKDSV